MCLTVTSRTPKKLKFVDGKATVYKILRKYTNKLISPYEGFRYKIGKNVAKGKLATKVKPFESDTINGGAIHVTFSKREALRIAYSWYDAIIVPCTVYEKDFVAEGTYNFSRYHAAFKSVTIDPDIYKKAVKSTRKDLFIRER